MDTTTYVVILTSLLGIVFAMLIGVLTWIGMRIHSKMDEFTTLLTEHIGDDSSRLFEISTKLGLIEKGLHSELSKLDRRLVIAEVKLDLRKEENDNHYASN